MNFVAEVAICVVFLIGCATSAWLLGSGICWIYEKLDDFFLRRSKFMQARAYYTAVIDTIIDKISEDECLTDDPEKLRKLILNIKEDLRLNRDFPEKK